MGLPWIELDVGMPEHPKSLAMAEALNDERAWSYMVKVWLYCARVAPDGLIKGTNAVAILERAAGWSGKRGEFYTAATAAGFVHPTDVHVTSDGRPPDVHATSILVHGWSERASAHVAKMERDAERQRERRAKVATRFAKRQPSDVHVTSDGRPPDIRVTSDGRPCDVQPVTADVHGNSKTNTNTNTNTNPNRKREEEEEVAAAPPAKVPQPVGTFPLVASRPEKPDDEWLGPDFMQWAQFKRQEAGLPVEAQLPHPSNVGATWHAAMMEGFTPADMRRGFIEFSRDEFWQKKKPPLPVAGFISQWRRYVRRQEVQHVA